MPYMRRYIIDFGLRPMIEIIIILSPAHLVMSAEGGVD